MGDYVRRAITGNECVFKHTFVDRLPMSGKPMECLKMFKLDAESVCQTIKELIA